MRDLLFIVTCSVIKFILITLGRVDLCGMKNKQHEDKV
jgi:hypothetical protein